MYEGGNVGEEFVETEYYKDLGGVGKQHHTIATAFFSTSCCFQLHSCLMICIVGRYFILNFRISIVFDIIPLELVCF